MNNEVEEIIKKCPTCLSFGDCQPHEPIINHPIPNQALKQIVVDLFHWYVRYCLLIIDYHSKFIFIGTLKNLQSSTVINKYKKSFSQFGTAKELVTYNGPESLAIISNRFRQPGILNIEPLVPIFTNQMD